MSVNWSNSLGLLGALAVENAYRLLKGESVKDEFVVPIKLITKENAAATDASK